MKLYKMGVLLYNEHNSTIHRGATTNKSQGLNSHTFSKKIEKG